MRTTRKDRLGHIELIIGPVYSGKTTELLRRVEQHKLANRSCCIVRFTPEPWPRKCDKCSRLYHLEEPLRASRIGDVLHKLRAVDVVAIDEGHFFDDVAERADDLARDGKIVLVAALNGDYLRKRFEVIIELFPRCEIIDSLKAVCTQCGDTASFSRKLTDTELEVSKQLGPYTPLCRYCYFASQKELCMNSIRRHGLCGDELSYDGEIEVIFGPMFSGKTQLMHDGISASKIEDVFEELLKYEVILIDEGQFFPDIVMYSELLANCGKEVIVSSLDGDFKREQEVIGGKDKYRATCRYCHMAYTQQNVDVKRARSPLHDAN